MILANIHTIKNKVDELQGNVHFQEDFRDCCVMAFTEIYLTEQDQDEDLSLSGFGAPYLLDRDTKVTGEGQVRGVCLYINLRYCNSVIQRANLHS